MNDLTKNLCLRVVELIYPKKNPNFSQKKQKKQEGSYLLEVSAHLRKYKTNQIVCHCLVEEEKKLVCLVGRRQTYTNTLSPKLETKITLF